MQRLAFVCLCLMVTRTNRGKIFEGSGNMPISNNARFLPNLRVSVQQVKNVCTHKLRCRVPIGNVFDLGG